MKQVLHLFQSGLPILPYQTNSDVGWGLMVFQLYITAILRHSFPVFVVWTDLTGFLIISFAVSRRTRGEREATPQLPFLMQRLWCSCSTPSTIRIKSLVNSSALSRASFPSLFAHHAIIVFYKEHLLVPLHQKLLILLQFSHLRVPHMTLTLFFNVLSDLFPQGLT